MMETVLLKGDLAGLKPSERVQYYNAVCQSVGLNPLTQPFAYIQLNGKLVLYAKRDCTDQLRKINNISITIPSREISEGCYVVTARAQTPNGRQDESLGSVAIENLKGENRSNAMMKAETKAKRRVTLSICGLAFMDEAEVDSVRGASHVTVNEDGDITSGTREAAQAVAQRKIEAGNPNLPIAETAPIIDAEPLDPEEQLHEDIFKALSARSTKKPFDLFKMLPEIAKLKKRFQALDQEAWYYRILNRCGVKKSNEFTDDQGGLLARVAYKELAMTLDTLEGAKLKSELEASVAAVKTDIPTVGNLPDAPECKLGDRLRSGGKLWEVVDGGELYRWSEVAE